MPDFNSKISDLITFAYEVFIHHKDQYVADYLTFNGKRFSNILTESLQNQIEQHIYATTDNAYVVIEIGFDDYCEGKIHRDLPTSNVLFQAVGEQMDLKFDNPNIYFPEECYPSGAAHMNIFNHTIKNAGNLPTKSIVHLSFVDCIFSHALKGLNGAMQILVFSNCKGLTTFSGTNLNKCTLIDMGYAKNNHCVLQDLNGLPPSLDLFTIHLLHTIKMRVQSDTDDYMDASEDYTSNSIIPADGVVYDNPSVLNAFSKCGTKFEYLFLSIPENYNGALLNFFFANADHIHFELSSNDTNLTRACLAVSTAINRTKSSSKHAALIECQEELIEMGLSKYAKI